MCLDQSLNVLDSGIDPWIFLIFMTSKKMSCSYIICLQDLSKSMLGRIFPNFRYFWIWRKLVSSVLIFAVIDLNFWYDVSIALQLDYQLPVLLNHINFEHFYSFFKIIFRWALRYLNCSLPLNLSFVNNFYIFGA